jgi:hypothetical protein
MDAVGDLTCCCDGARLRQVISNLLGKALDHGSEDGDVQLSIAAEESDIVLVVRNRGTPIPRDLLPTIFDPLVRDNQCAAAPPPWQRWAGSVHCARNCDLPRRHNRSHFIRGVGHPIRDPCASSSRPH